MLVYTSYWPPSEKMKHSCQYCPTCLRVGEEQHFEFHTSFSKSWADFMVRLLLVSGPSPSSYFFHGRSSLVLLLNGPLSPESPCQLGQGFR